MTKATCKWVGGLAAAAVLAAAGGPAAAEVRPGVLVAPQMANGLIVRLRDAPAHAAVEREKALSAGRRSALGEVHQARLQRVLRESALDRAAIDVPSAPRIDPTGSASQVLRFERLLTLEQAQRLAKRLAARPDVAWAEPNAREQPLQSTNPSDPGFPASGGNPYLSEGQWWLFPVNGASGSARADRRRGVPDFQTAWRTLNGARVAVAVLDTGITPHSDLANVGVGYDFVSTVGYAGDGDGRDADPSDPGDYVSSTDRTAYPGLFSSDCASTSSWHGTKIAGLIGAATNNGQGVAGANWNALVVPVRVAGKCGADVADIADGIRWAAGLTVPNVSLVNSNPARVINISFGGTGDCSSTSEGRLYQEAINAARAAGAVVVAAAGNENRTPTRPASCSNVIGVAALNRDGFKASYSNFGPTLTIATVGGDSELRGAWGSYLGDTGLLTTSNAGPTTPGSEKYEPVFGTSFSAPLVSAAISLMLGRNASLTADQIVSGLQVSARPHVISSQMANCSSANPGRCTCTTTTCGAGILDVPRALAYAADPGGYSPPVQPPAIIDSTDLSSAIASASQDLPANPVDPSGGGGGSSGPCGRDGVCAGAMQPAWLLGLLAAAAALRPPRRRRSA